MSRSEELDGWGSLGEEEFSYLKGEWHLLIRSWESFLFYVKVKDNNTIMDCIDMIVKVFLYLYYKNKKL